MKEACKQFQDPTLADVLGMHGTQGPSEATTPVLPCSPPPLVPQPHWQVGGPSLAPEVALGGPSSVQLRTGLMAVPVARLHQESMACGSGNLS